MSDRIVRATDDLARNPMIRELADNPDVPEVWTDDTGTYVLITDEGLAALKQYLGRHQP